MIRPLKPTSKADRSYQQVEDIFFLTSSKQDFSSPQARQDFAAKYLDFYLFGAGLAFGYFDEHTLLGYITACQNSHAATDQLSAHHAYYKLFDQAFDDYPAHLHINVHPKTQGKGIGRKLIHHLEGYLQAEDIPGVHLITGQQASNRAFYQAMSYTEILQRPLGESQLVLLGKRLSAL